MDFKWANIQLINSKEYKCGYCGKSLVSEKGYLAVSDSTGVKRFIYICHYCEKATFLDEGDNQTPSIVYGEDIENIDDISINQLYKEARYCFSTNSFTATILCCRKILMHISVNKGAAPGLKFIEYVEYLSSNNYIPQGSKDWVDHIRKKGNEANHEIKIMSKEDAKDLISFTEMLLKIIFDFPSRIKNK